MADENPSSEMVVEDDDVEYVTDSDDEMDESLIVDSDLLTTEQKADLAESKKGEGNIHYGHKNYLQAIALYTEAIELCPKCAAYYGNRAAAYVMLNNFSLALRDARSAVEIDPTFVKGYLRIAKCHVSMGEMSAAINAYQKVLELEPGHAAAQAELSALKTTQMYEASATDSYSKGDFRKVVFCMDRCIQASPGSIKYKVLKAECLALLKRYQEAQEIANDLLRLDSTNADAIYVRGMCLYYEDNMDKAYQHFQQVLRLAPDHEKARQIYKKSKALSQKKEEGNAAFRASRLQQAYELYTEALAIDPHNVFTNAKLYCNRATVSTKLRHMDQAVEDCNKAIELDETYVKAYHRRAKCFQSMEQHEEAVRDYEKIYKMDKSRENKQLLSEAKLELKKSLRKDYYKLLGVGKDANDDEIKKAYRKRALQHHPDRHSNASESERKEQEKKFKEIGEAYTVLSDPKKKARYDSGQDLDDMGGAGGFADMDPNNIFQAFFGGGGGGFPGGMGGHHHHHHGGFHQQQQQGFPGGFHFQFG